FRCTRIPASITGPQSTERLAVLGFVGFGDQFPIFKRRNCSFLECGRGLILLWKVLVEHCHALILPLLNCRRRAWKTSARYRDIPPVLIHLNRASSAAVHRQRAFMNHTQPLPARRDLGVAVQPGHKVCCPRQEFASLSVDTLV